MSDFFLSVIWTESYTKLSVQAIFFKSFLPTKLTVFDNPAVLAHSSYIVLSFILHVHVVNCNCINNKHVNSNQIIKECMKNQLCFNYWCWSIHSLALKGILFPWNHGTCSMWVPESFIHSAIVTFSTISPSEAQLISHSIYISFSIIEKKNVFEYMKWSRPFISLFFLSFFSPSYDLKKWNIIMFIKYWMNELSKL